MTTRFEPTDILSQYAAITAMNDNFAEIATLLDTFVSRMGTAPNAMLANLDMNHFKMNNVGDGTSDSDAVNLGQVSSLIGSIGPLTNASVPVATRSLLAALTSTDFAALLMEPSREGIFVFSSSNHSADITRDPFQGVFVPPASDPTGASGAWVRKYNGPINALWFGAVADCTGYGVGTDNSPALQAAINFLYNTGGWVYVPDGRYRCSSLLVIKSAIKLLGTTTLQDGTAATHPLADKGSTLVFDAAVGGIRFSYVTDTDTIGTATNPGSGGSTIEGFRLFSASQGAPAAGKFGLDIRTKIKASNLFVFGFGDTNVIIQASTAGSGGSDGVVYGNASGAILEQVHSSGSAVDGFVVSGADANFCKLVACNAINNVGWGFTDNSLIGTTYDTCISANTAGQYRTLRVGTSSVYINCDDEGGTSSLNTSCTTSGGVLSQKNWGQRFQVHGLLQAYDGLTVSNGGFLTISNTGDTNNGTIQHDGTNIRVTGLFRVVGTTTMRQITPDVDNTYTVGQASARFAGINTYTLDAKTSVVINSGTPVTGLKVYTPTLTPVSVAAATVAEQTFTVPGLTTADKVFVNQPAITNATGISGARVSAADTLAIRFVNPTAGALTPTSGVFTVLAIRS